MHSEARWRKVSTIRDYPPHGGEYLILLRCGQMRVCEFDSYRDYEFLGFEEFDLEDVAFWAELPERPKGA